MIKNNALRRILIASLSLIFVSIVYFFPNNNSSFYKTSSEYIEAIEMPIYILDKNNYVARTSVLRTTFDIEDNIKYIIKTLTVGSNESEYLSSNFIPIIPENTKLYTLHLNDGLLKLDFSKDFLNISENLEIKLIESIIFSLCEFEEVDKIIIFVEGNNLSHLPNSNKELPLVLDKNYGINKIYDISSLKDTNETILYFLGTTDSNETYYIPITKIENTNENKIEVIIKNLQTSPINQTNLISYLKASATLEYYEILEESVLLSFNNSLIADLNDETILEEVQYSLFLSIRDSLDIKQVIFEDSSSISVSLFN